MFNRTSRNIVQQSSKYTKFVKQTVITITLYIMLHVTINNTQTLTSPY